jgi:hypothetical protein
MVTVFTLPPFDFAALSEKRIAFISAAAAQLITRLAMVLEFSNLLQQHWGQVPVPLPSLSEGS